VPRDGVGEGFAPVRRLLGERKLIEHAHQPGDEKHRRDADHHAGLGGKAGVQAAQRVARGEHGRKFHDPESARERGARDRRRGRDEIRGGHAGGERQEDDEHEGAGEGSEVDGAALRNP
jgi:hypothetical protein